MSIGLSQLTSAFGFAGSGVYSVPKAGQPGFEENWEVMEWIVHNWNAKYNYPASDKKSKTYNGKTLINPIGTQIWAGLFIPLIIMVFIKQSITSTPERKKRMSFRIWTIISSIFPFIGLIIATNLTWKYKTTDWSSNPEKAFYMDQLKIVGTVKPGLDILRSPKFRHPFGPFFVACIPCALVLYMESYAVARRIASINNELHLLNASQVRTHARAHPHTHAPLAPPRLLHSV